MASTNDFTSDSPAPIQDRSREASGVHPSAVGPEPRFQSQSQTQDSTDATDGHEGTRGGDNEGLDQEYPEQLHAGPYTFHLNTKLAYITLRVGKVGLGPEYGQKNRETHGITAKIKGFKEEVKGTITRNSELVQKGKERQTGELAKKDEEKDDVNPFEQGKEGGGGDKQESEGQREGEGRDREGNFDSERNDRRDSDSRQYGDDNTGTNSSAVNNNDEPFQSNDQSFSTSNDNNTQFRGRESFTDADAREEAATTEPEGSYGASREAEEGRGLQRDAQMGSVQQTGF